MRVDVFGGPLERDRSGASWRETAKGQTRPRGSCAGAAKATLEEAAGGEAPQPTNPKALDLLVWGGLLRPPRQQSLQQ